MAVQGEQGQVGIGFNVESMAQDGSFSHGAASGLDVTMEGSQSLSHTDSHGTLHLRAQ